jgi:hypothetical protein
MHLYWVIAFNLCECCSGYHSALLIYILLSYKLKKFLRIFLVYCDTDDCKIIISSLCSCQFFC